MPLCINRLLIAGISTGWSLGILDLEEPAGFLTLKACFHQSNEEWMTFGWSRLEFRVGLSGNVIRVNFSWKLQELN
jgi:hypothetical protein